MQSCIHECGKSLQAWTALAVHSQAVQLQSSNGTYMCSSCLKPLVGPQQCCPQGSTLVLDVTHQQLFCVACRSFIHNQAYDTALQLLHVHNKYINLGLSPGLQPNEPAQEVLDRRQRLQDLPLGSWAPGPDSWQLQQQALALHQQHHHHQFKQSKVPTITCAPGKAFMAACSHDGLPLGLRGLNNLGNTCFMNSVLQAFAHAPLIRNYFLGDGHSPHTCKRGHVKPCLACELDGVINNMYSGERQPFSPVDFLYGWWTVADHLAEYQQQDAHEFYLSALSALSGTKVTPPPYTDGGQQPGAADTSAPHIAAGNAQLQRLPTAWPEVGVKAESIKQEQVLQGTGFLNGMGSTTGLGDLKQEQQGIKAEGIKLEGNGFAFHQAAGAAGVPLTSGTAHGNHQPYWPEGLMQEQQQQQLQQETGGDAVSGLGGGVSTGGTLGPQPSGSYVTQSQVPATGQGGGDAPSASLVEAIFGGLLRSDVTCSVCGHTSTAFDPFLDISLDMVTPDLVAQMADLQPPIPMPQPMPAFMPQSHLPPQPPVPNLIPQPPLLAPPMLGAGFVANGHTHGAATGAGFPNCIPDMPPSVNGAVGDGGNSGGGGGVPGDSVSGVEGGATELTCPLARSGSAGQQAGAGAAVGDGLLTRVGSPTTVGSPQHVSGLGPMLKSESGSLEAMVAVKEEGGCLGPVAGAGVAGGQQHLEQTPDRLGSGGRRRQWEPGEGEGGKDVPSSKRPSPGPSYLGNTQLASAEGMPGGNVSAGGVLQDRAHGVTVQRQGSTSLQKAGLPPLPAQRPGPHPLPSSVLGAPLQPLAPTPPPPETSIAQPEVSVSDAQESHAVVPSGGGGGPQHSSFAPSASEAPPAAQLGMPGAPAARQQAGSLHLPDPMQWEVADDISSPLRVPPSNLGPVHQPPPYPGMVQGAGSTAAHSPPFISGGPSSDADTGPGGLPTGGAQGPPAPAPPAAGGKGKKGGGGGKKGGGGGAVARVTRCGHCYTCLHKHLKKGCLRNKAEREGIAWPGPSNDSQQQQKESQARGTVSNSTASLPQPSSSQQAPSHLQASQGPRSQPPVSLPSNGLQTQGGRRGAGTPTPEASEVQGGSHPPQGTAQHRAAPGRGHHGSKAASEGTEEVGEVSTLVEPACSHLAMQTEAWPLGQGQHSLGGAGAQPSSRAGGGRRSPSVQRAIPAPSQEPSCAPAAAARTTGGHNPGDCVTLEACLRYYTRRELLTLKDAWVCGHCKKKQPAVKQMSIRRLPPVLCLHIKRFEHAAGSSRVLRKLQGQLVFSTAQLDLSPFMTPTILRARHQAGSSIPRPLSWQVEEGDGTAPEAPGPGDGTLNSWSCAPGNNTTGVQPGNAGAQQSWLYSLFAVVVHKGDIQGGHYITYVRCGGSWFCCDDAWVTLVEESEVAAAQAYMLFLTSSDYHQEAPLGLVSRS